ncbi:hypothetical protein [Nocardioides sp.]|uniref:hypothetical protein n=1 Tax=Nocardioides sp. TaxID=35761 RepID=UPI003784F35B
MQHLIRAARQAVQQGNWYAALSLALTLPDICGKLENPSHRSRQRYVTWCDAYLVPKYTHLIGSDREPHVFLHGDDCYALRCAVLHEGADDILEQHARKALTAFRFVTPPRGGGQIHCNQINSILQLQVDVFCEDVCQGVDTWIELAQATNPEAMARVDRLMEIEVIGPSFSM